MDHLIDGAFNLALLLLFSSSISGSGKAGMLSGTEEKIQSQVNCVFYLQFDISKSMYLIFLVWYSLQITNFTVARKEILSVKKNTFSKKALQKPCFTKAPISVGRLLRQAVAEKIAGEALRIDKLKCVAGRKCSTLLSPCPPTAVSCSQI